MTPGGAERRVVVRIGGDEDDDARGSRRPLRGRLEGAAHRELSGRGDARARTAIATGSRDSAGRVTVYRPAAASWYGPGLYGNPLACGGTLTASTIGVANKTLPCGTKLRLRYGNSSVTVPVIDRGPFAGSREFDLTAATKQALGFPDVGTVLTAR